VVSLAVKYLLHITKDLEKYENKAIRYSLKSNIRSNRI
jgi:hypothetical protein